MSKANFYDENLNPTLVDVVTENKDGTVDIGAGKLVSHARVGVAKQPEAGLVTLGEKVPEATEVKVGTAAFYHPDHGAPAKKFTVLKDNEDGTVDIGTGTTVVVAGARVVSVPAVGHVTLGEYVAPKVSKTHTK